MGDYAAAVGVLAAAVAIVLALYAASMLLGAERRPLASEPFLSGMAPVEHAASRFHMRWYPVTLLFLAFDMEMVVMYPWARVVAEVGTPSVVEMFVFLAVLLTGVGYAWREGALRWT